MPKRRKNQAEVMAPPQAEPGAGVMKAPCVDKCRVAEALQYAVFVLESIADYTSRHCSDCLRNHYRAEQALIAIKKALDVPLYSDIHPASADKLRAAVRKLETEARKMLGEQ
jgi:hypothetical protein